MSEEITAIFHGRYSWNGKKDSDKEPISWFPGAYDIHILKLADLSRDIKHMRPYICLFTNTGSGFSVSANPEKFAKRICEDFSLEMEKVLWVERAAPDEDKYEVILFKKSGQLGKHSFFSMQKRKPMSNEFRLIYQNILGTQDDTH